MKRIHSLILSIALAFLVCQEACPSDGANKLPENIVQDIIHAATANPGKAKQQPLPLAAHWNTGQRNGGFDPSYQMQLIRQGHRILPWFHFPVPGKKADTGYYEQAIKTAARYRLPISFVGTQWERLLTTAQQYLTLPPEKNPNVVSRNGEILEKVSPFGPIAPWRDVGSEWTTTSAMHQIQEWYPDPPLVLFVSNNEHRKLTWHELEESKRYVQEHERGNRPAAKQRVVGEAWIERYRALQEGMRQSLHKDDWKNDAKFIAYNALGPSAFGRWPGWIKYSLHTDERFSPWPLAWDGTSLPYYVHNWNSSTDFQVMSPQIQALNWIFMLDEAYRNNPDFWLEISTWDGHEPEAPNDKRACYARLGQEYDPDRYQGMVQFGMWLLRPRVVREFRAWTDTVKEAGPYFQAVLEAVDSVHEQPLLRKFWQAGHLVVNDRHHHPYQSNIPHRYQQAPRWFLLDTDLDSRRPWNRHTYIPVFTLGMVMGEKPERQWLVYLFSPLGKREKVSVKIPGYMPIELPAIRKGVFYHVTENGRVEKAG